MSASQSLLYQWTGAGEVISHTITETDAAQVTIDESVADGQTDVLVACVIDVSEIAMLFIVSSQDVTLETNSGAAPDDSFSLRANEPLVWHTNSYHTRPLTVDVTGLYVTNASGAAANVKVRCLYDSTP